MSRTLVVLFVVSLLLLPGGAGLAEPVTPQRAEAAVRAWLAMDAAPLGATLGRQVVGVQAFEDDQGQAAYYIVYLEPSGLVIVSGEDLVGLSCDPGTLAGTTTYFSEVTAKNWCGETLKTFNNSSPIYDVWSDWIDGNVVNLNLVTDKTVQRYGFQVDAYEVMVSDVPSSGVTITLTPGVLTTVTGRGRALFIR